RLTAHFGALLGKTSRHFESSGWFVDALVPSVENPGLRIPKPLLIESGDLGQLFCAFEPGHSIRPKRMTQTFGRLARIGIGVYAGPAHRDQLGQRIQVDGQRRPAALAPITMDLVGTVK